MCYVTNVVTVATIVFLFGIIIFNSVNKSTKNGNKMLTKQKLKTQKLGSEKGKKERLSSVNFKQKGGENI